MHPRSFDPRERGLLLKAPQIGPAVIQRLEEVGVCSISDLILRGVEPTVQEICLREQQPAWANRRDALVRALCDALVAETSPGHRDRR